jgi:hypothetical protein
VRPVDGPFALFEKSDAYASGTPSPSTSPGTDRNIAPSAAPVSSASITNAGFALSDEYA